MDNEHETLVVHYVMMHYSLKVGLKRFGEHGKAAITKELIQIHHLNTFEPRDANTMTEEGKWSALSALLFLTEKRDKSIKARACADRRKQHQWTSKNDAASTTVSTQAIFMTGAIDAHEGCDVATMDLPGAFYMQMWMRM